MSETSESESAAFDFARASSTDIVALGCEGVRSWDGVMVGCMLAEWARRVHGHGMAGAEHQDGQ